MRTEVSGGLALEAPTRGLLLEGRARHRIRAWHRSAIVERYASLGTSVVINHASDERRARETVDAIEREGGRAIAVQADVGKVADIDRLFVTAVDRFGHLDVVVANAGGELVGQQVIDFTEAFLVSAQTASITRTEYVIDGGTVPTV